jgi:4-hydroxy-tetrahydrodipicolinate reductase
MTIKLGIVGCSGRMGVAILAELESYGQFIVVTGSCRNERRDLGEIANLGRHLGVVATPHIDEVFQAADVVIEFTSPAGAVECYRAAAKHGKPLVSGTTGLDDDARAVMCQAAQDVPIFYAPNMSDGVAVLAQLVTQAAKQLGDAFDIEIIESHHSGKKDVPSGTALMLAEATGAESIACGRTPGINLRRRGEVTISSIRGGAIHGKHEVMFCGEHETITITHEAMNRKALARGALKAAQWLIDQAPGQVYSTLLGCLP